MKALTKQSLGSRRRMLARLVSLFWRLLYLQWAALFSDRFGGPRVLLPVFVSIAALATLMASSWIPLFTVGALGAAAGLGLGSGAVFELVPRHFPKEIGTVTGLVGAFNGLDGFFPPLVLGVIRDATASYVLGFILLSATALLCLAVNYVVFVRPGPE
jgi:NNP family nitrate/nitrite transporter-like MFS transporter